ncbi:MAG: ribosomal protection-like ABC-F family protein [Bacilli bacterium]
MIQIQNVNKSFPGKVIYNNASVNIYKKEIVGIVGRNGVGKSTLFEMILDLIPYEGNIEIIKGLKMGYYTQDLVLDETITVNEILYKQFDHLFAMEEKLLELAHDFEKNQDEYEKVFFEFESQGGYFITSNINAMIKMFKLDNILEQKIATLSGGQKGRVALAKILLTKPDILLLDEPLNHLDLEAIEWLENFLNSNIETFIVISHDRFFLDNVCNNIIEVKNHNFYKYKGNYSKYLDDSEHNDLTIHNIYDKQQAEIKKLNEQIKQFRIWGNARDSEKMFKKAKELEKRLSKIEVIDAPTIEKNMRLNFNYSFSNSQNIIWCENLAIGYDKVLIDNLNFDVYKGDRIALVGANGCGKSTLLKVLANKLMPLKGDINFATNIKVAYFDQIFEELDKTSTIKDEVHKDNVLLNNYQIRSHLAKFLFKNEDLNKKISDLSGGECVRVSLAKLSLQESNVLILDEPTNHLDLESKQVVEMALSSYEGAIIFSSHDRYLINKLANKIFEFNKNEMRIINKTYNEYIVERDLKFEVEADEVVIYDYIVQKQIKSLKNKIINIEEEIGKKESQIKRLEKLKFDEDIYTCENSYNEILEEIKQCNTEIEELILETIKLENEIDML